MDCFEKPRAASEILKLSCFLLFPAPSNICIAFWCIPASACFRILYHKYKSISILLYVKLTSYQEQLETAAISVFVLHLVASILRSKNLTANIFLFHVCGTKNPPQNSCNHFHNTVKMVYSLSFSSLILS